MLTALPNVPPHVGRPERGAPLVTAAPEEAGGPWATAVCAGAEGSSSPPDADSPEPPRVAGRGHPDILLPVPGLRRAHRVCQLQLAQVGLDTGRAPSGRGAGQVPVLSLSSLGLPAWDGGDLV